SSIVARVSASPRCSSEKSLTTNAESGVSRVWTISRASKRKRRMHPVEQKTWPRNSPRAETGNGVMSNTAPWGGITVPQGHSRATEVRDQKIMGAQKGGRNVQVLADSPSSRTV